MQRWTFDSRGPDETFEYGVELGRSIGAEGLVIGLVGPLAAGKTVFVKGLARGLGVDPRLVSSPTFVIAQQYRLMEGPDTLHHLDLYRLESEGELETVGLYDMLAPGSVLAVEWADRFPGALGSEVLEIEFEGPSPAEEEAAREGVPARGRRVCVLAQGPVAELVLGDWAERIDNRETRSGESGSGGGAIASSPSMRALVMLLAAVGLLALGRSLSDGRYAAVSTATTCAAIVEVEADRLGTRRARCLAEVPFEASRSSGIGRLVEGGSIDLNTAPGALLRALPEIGPARAEAIVRTRAERPFTDIADLERVPGIGRKIRTRVGRWLHVGRASRGEADG